MVADLVSKARRYYETPESLPGEGGVTNVRYKTDCLVMRRIPAKGVQWRMGRREGEPITDSSSYTTEVQHYVKMTDDYYIGVYPLTWGQYRNLMSTAVDSALKAAGSDLPVTNQTWASMRGTSNGSTAPTSGSLMGKARTALGSDFVDFPTDEQWEYACRACCAAPFANGAANYAGGADEMGWYSDNSGSPKHTHPVGTKNPNAWGLYDMHGQVWEMCLDGWYTPTSDSVTESLHNPSEANKISRGGCFRHGANQYGRSAVRLKRSNSQAQYDQGFRLADRAVAR
jgi:formylglycine-generating enzyme required for sulfatase activity